MNLDDLLVPNSAGSPLAVSRSPSTDTLTTAHAPSALPIRGQHGQHRDNTADGLHVSRSSMPLSAHARNAEHTEFGYIQKRYRKTSVDERMVRAAISLYERQ